MLGIIEQVGTVRLKVAGALTCPGHLEWARQDSLANPYRGFSLIVKAGQVASFHRRSEFNLAELDFVLEDEITRDLLRLLPCLEGIQMFPDLDRSETDDALD